MKNQLTKLILSDKRQSLSKAVEENVWHASKKFNSNSNNIPTRIIVQDRITSSPKEISETFNQFFHNKITRLRREIGTDCCDLLTITCACLDEPNSKFSFTTTKVTEVFEHIHMMKKSKATGLDNISSYFLKTSSAQLRSVTWGLG